MNTSKHLVKGIIILFCLFLFSCTPNGGGGNPTPVASFKIKKMYGRIVEDNINGRLALDGIEKIDSMIFNYNSSGLISNAKYYSSTSNYNEEYVFAYRVGSVQIQKTVSDSSDITITHHIYYYNAKNYITQIYTPAFQTYYNYDDSGKITSTRLFQNPFLLRIDSNFVYDIYNNLLSFDYTTTFYTFEYNNLDMSSIFRSDINHEIFNGSLAPFGGYNNTAPLLGSNGLSLDIHFPLGIDLAPLMGLSFGVNGNKELIRKTVTGDVVGGTASANYTYEKDSNGRVSTSSNTIINSNGQTKTRTISFQY